MREIFDLNQHIMYSLWQMSSVNYEERHLEFHLSVRMFDSVGLTAEKREGQKGEKKRREAR